MFNKKILSRSWISYAERSGTKISTNGKVLLSICPVNFVIQTVVSIAFSTSLYNVQCFHVISSTCGMGAECPVACPM